MRQILLISILIGVLNVFTFCQQTNNHKRIENQKEIITLYGSEYLSTEFQYLYYRSIEKKELQSLFDPPLTLDDFKLPQIALPPKTSQIEIDTIFSKEELESWNKQINEYKQIEWDGSLFSGKIKIMSKDEIPAYLQRTDIPPPRQNPVFIHVISSPFMYDDKTALMYSKRWSSGANNKIRYHYFVKTNAKWLLKKTGRLNVGY